MGAFLLHSIPSTSKTHAVILSGAPLQLVPVPGVLTPATWGRHYHMYPSIICYATAGPQPLLCLIHSPRSLGCSTSRVLPPLPFPFLHPSFHASITTSNNLALLKSAAIKTDARLKCHKCISNCKNINLFTLSCLAFPLGVKGVG